MPFTLTLPKLSPTMEEGSIAKWRVHEGSYVKAGDVLFEITTDKATVEHAALDSGYLRKILVPEGQEALVNQAVAIFTEKKEESIEGYKPEGVSPKAKTPPPAAPEKKQEVFSMPPDTPALKQPAFIPEPPLEEIPSLKPSSKIKGRLPASPLARKLAKEKGIDLSTIAGSGPQSRIVSTDLPLGQPDLPVTFGRDETPTAPPGSFEEEPLTPIRKTIAQRLQAAKSSIPHFYLTQEIRTERLLDAREQLKNLGHKLSINDFIIRATALALRQHPQVNSGFNSATQTLIRFKTIDISVAVSIEDGLITPIIRYADFKNLGQISQEVKVLAQKAREGKLQREEYMGGSFTISNLGMYNISQFGAIINPPQAAILAVGAIEEKPVVEKGAVVPGKVMHLTLSCDHRVIDGAEGAKFLVTLRSFLENPSSLLMS